MEQVWNTIAEALDGKTIPLLIGLFSGWALFELTDRIKVRRARSELRRALVAELEFAECIVSTIVGKYARCAQTDQEIEFVANEIRWFCETGRARMRCVGILSDLPGGSPNMLKLSDGQLVQQMSSIEETIGTQIILPVVDRAISGQTSLFTSDQIQSLSMVHWQSHLLAQDADSMKEMFLLSLTLGKDPNHQIVIKNHDRNTKRYADRAATLLRSIRATLSEFKLG